MPKFSTAYSEKKRIHCPKGDPERPIYEYKVNGKGQKKLEITGWENVDEKIQAEAENVKIENVLKRVAIGDMSDFRADGIYEDISEMPNSMVEAMQEMQKVENHWKKLPTEIKNKYNNDVKQYMAEVGSESWMKNMGLIKEVEKTDEKKPEKTKIDTGKEEK